MSKTGGRNRPLITGMSTATLSNGKPAVTMWQVSTVFFNTAFQVDNTTITRHVERVTVECDKSGVDRTTNCTPSLKPGPHQQQCRSNVRLCCQRQHCRSNRQQSASTLLLVWTGLKSCLPFRTWHARRLFRTAKSNCLASRLTHASTREKELKQTL